MNDIDRITTLAAMQNDDAMPPASNEFINGVLADIRRTPHRSPDRTWAIAATSAALVAVVATVIAAGAWLSLFNPLSSLGGADTLTAEMR